MDPRCAACDNNCNVYYDVKGSGLTVFGNNVCPPVSITHSIPTTNHAAPGRPQNSNQLYYNMCLGSVSWHFFRSLWRPSTPGTVAVFFRRSPVHLVPSDLRQSFPGSCHKSPMVTRAMSTPTFHLSIFSYSPCLILRTHSLSHLARVWILRLFQKAREAPQLDLLIF